MPALRSRAHSVTQFALGAPPLSAPTRFGKCNPALPSPYAQALALAQAAPIVTSPVASWSAAISPAIAGLAAWQVGRVASRAGAGAVGVVDSVAHEVSETVEAVGAVARRAVWSVGGLVEPLCQLIFGVAALAVGYASVRRLHWRPCAVRHETVCPASLQRHISERPTSGN